MDAEVPFLCGKRKLEGWNFNKNGRDKILEIESKTDGSRIRIKMIDTEGGHYGIILETRKKNNVLYLKDALGEDLGVLFFEDKQDEICSFKAMRKVHEVNWHTQKEKHIGMPDGCLQNS